MAVTFGFYNSVAGDRAYNAEQMGALFDGLIQDGVFASIGDWLYVRPSTPLAMSITVGIGRAWFNRTWTFNDSDLVLSIDEADVAYTRIDAVVLEVDATESVRANSIKIIKGTAAASPVPPTMTHTALLNQYPLAWVTVPVGTTTIDFVNLTNNIGSTLVPYVVGVLQDFDITFLTDQWGAQWDAWTALQESEFDTWFTNLVNQLTENQATNLQNQIDIINAKDFPEVIARQGGVSLNWNFVGTTNYTDVVKPGIQVGNSFPNSSGDGIVTFPEAFTHNPIVIVVIDSSPGGTNVTAIVTGTSATGFTYRVVEHLTVAPYHRPSPYTVATTVNWLAIGPIV